MKVKPSRCSRGELAKVGVTFSGYQSGKPPFACQKCRTEWSVIPQPSELRGGTVVRAGGKRPKGWWKCPNGCNA